MELPYGLRLKEERDRLGLNQEEFAELGGAKSRAYWNYEKGKVAPDADFLARLCEKGVDVLFVLTGRHSFSAAEPQPPEYFNPARQVAGIIAALDLSQEDAALVTGLARRLAAPK